MNVAFVTRSLSRGAGGLFFAMDSLAGALSEQGVTVVAHGSNDGQILHDLDTLRQAVCQVHPTIGIGALACAPTMKTALVTGNYDLLHTHGLWQWSSIAVGHWHKQTRRPYVVSPHGMLDPWALQQSRWKKKLAWMLYENEHLRKSACIHALCESEARSFRAYGLKNPVCVIPNGVDLPDLAVDRGHGERATKTLLFLGRLHPKKGLVNALRAWARIVGSGGDGLVADDGCRWQFAIAGWDQGGHVAELRRLCVELGLTHADVSAEAYVARAAPDAFVPVPRSGAAHLNLPAVVFLGPAFGETKDALLRAADAFILPSFSEGLPMAVLEAWAYQLPVLMTDSCNLPAGFSSGAAVLIGTDVKSMAYELKSLLSSPQATRQSMGKNGRRLVVERFSWPQAAAQMKEIYEWVLGGGAKPTSIV
jgi:glycosyltransferase involved in cell wall biosynthesis